MASQCSALWLGTGFYGAGVNLKTPFLGTASAREVIWGFCLDWQLCRPITSLSSLAKGIKDSLAFIARVNASDRVWEAHVTTAGVKQPRAPQHMSHIWASLVRYCRHTREGTFIHITPFRHKAIQSKQMEARYTAGRNIICKACDVFLEPI